MQGGIWRPPPISLTPAPGGREHLLDHLAEAEVPHSEGAARGSREARGTPTVSGPPPFFLEGGGSLREALGTVLLAARRQQQRLRQELGRRSPGQRAWSSPCDGPLCRRTGSGGISGLHHHPDGGRGGAWARPTMGPVWPRRWCRGSWDVTSHTTMSVSCAPNRRPPADQPSSPPHMQIPPNYKQPLYLSNSHR